MWDLYSVTCEEYGNYWLGILKLLQSGATAMYDQNDVEFVVNRKKELKKDEYSSYNESTDPTTQHLHTVYVHRIFRTTDVQITF